MTGQQPRRSGWKTGLTSCLAAFLLAQAAGPLVADEMPCRWQRWEKAIAAFAAQDELRPPPQHGVLFVGSSSVRLWDLPKYFPEETTINRGFGGSQICDSNHFLDSLVLKHRPRVVHLLESGI